MKKSFFFIIFMLLSANNVNADLSIVVNPNNTDSLTSEEIKLIFLGKKSNFSNGSEIYPVSFPETSREQAEFLKKVINKSEIQFKIYWAKKIFTGKGTPPKEYNNSKEIIDIIKANPNSIGFIVSSDLTSDVKEIAKY